MKGSNVPAYRVRQAQEHDLASLPQVEHAASQLFRDTPYPEIAGEQLSSIDEFRVWLERASLFVAVTDDDEPVGFAVAFELDGCAHLHEIDVDPRHGRRGVGRSLIANVTSWAQDRGYKQITLTTFRDVAWNAPFYELLGFRELALENAGPGLRALRAKEERNGLKVEDRLFMVADIAQPK